MRNNRGPGLFQGMDPLDQNRPVEIRDIIKSDSDRLFIVDPECYIIFTGETTDDIKPFIRIGNWSDMPVELVPLIENIIITDGLVGNPSHEQFNIDVRHLPHNRYIGSRGTVQRFPQLPEDIRPGPHQRIDRGHREGPPGVLERGKTYRTRTSSSACSTGTATSRRSSTRTRSST